MRRTIRRTSAAALAVATLTLASACGSGGSGDHAKDANAHPTTSEELAPGSALDAADSKDVMTSMVNTMSSMRMTGDVTLSSLGGIHMEGVEQMKPTVLAEMKETIAGQDMDVRMIGTKMYIQMPAGAGIPGGKKWMSMDFQELGSLSGADTSSVGEAMQDPASAVSKYAKYVTGGTYVGSEKVDGTSAKHYTFTIDVKGAMSAMMPSGVPSAAATTMPDSMTEDVWLDSDGHPVQVKVDMGKAGVTTMHMSDFGTKVSVTPPPASEVSDMKDLLGKAGQR